MGAVSNESEFTLPKTSGKSIQARSGGQRIPEGPKAIQMLDYSSVAYVLVLALFNMQTGSANYQIDLRGLCLCVYHKISSLLFIDVKPTIQIGRNGE